MHPIQQRILKLAKEMNLGTFTLRQIGGMIGETSPQKIKHHLLQLQKRGLVQIDKENSVIKSIESGWVNGLLTDARLLSIPIVGTANAGPALSFADENIEGYLRVSDTLLGSRANHRLFAVKIDGPSMNRAEVDGKTIEDGDYVIVDGDVRTPRDGQIIVSIIDGMANVKRFHLDREYHQIILRSDSTQEFPPICIHTTDRFSINGIVIQVIKRQ